MKSNKSKMTVWAIVTGILLVFGPYQNCSIHQSEGRKNFEKLMRSNVQTSNIPHCMPYISENDASDIFSSTATTSSTGPSDSLVCKIQGSEEFFGLEFAVCTMKSDYRMQSSPATIARNLGITIYENKVYYFVPGQSVISGEIGTVTPPEGGEQNFYGVAEQKTDSDIIFHFFNTELSLECRFTLSKSAYDNPENGLNDSAARRGSLLMHKIFENCNNSICPID